METVYTSLVEEYGFNRLDKVSASKVNVAERIETYDLGAGKLVFYRVKPTFGDSYHPFRSSPKIVGELVNDEGSFPISKLFYGSEDSFEEVKTVLSG